MIRKGPRPLSVHIGMTASSFPGKGETGEGAFSDMMRKMLLGIRQYQLHPFEPKRPRLHTVWEQGSVTVKGVTKSLKNDDAPVMLLIPSMINRAYILDLIPKRSLLQWLNKHGIRAYLLDWGEPVSDAGMKTIESALMKRLIPATKFLAQKTGAPVHALGYCMGGTLLAGAAAMAPEFFRSLTFLASPWDFHGGSRALMDRVKFWAPSSSPLIKERGYLPVDWIQTVFASVSPDATAKKFAHFATMDPQSEDAKIFVAVEDWLNDGVDLPAELAREPIHDWFLENRPYKGKWKVGRKTIKARSIKTPSLIITSKKDRLVEYETAVALAKQIRGAEIVNSGCGHIGMMAGKQAVEKVWQPIAEWVKKNN